MPAVNGSLGNCYRLTIDGQRIGYFTTHDQAVFYKKILEKFYGREVVCVIELWFIEGEF